jgi:hypothetical protein
MQWNNPCGTTILHQETATSDLITKQCHVSGVTPRMLKRFRSFEPLLRAEGQQARQMTFLAAGVRHHVTRWTEWMAYFALLRNHPELKMRHRKACYACCNAHECSIASKLLNTPWKREPEKVWCQVQKKSLMSRLQLVDFRNQAAIKGAKLNRDVLSSETKLPYIVYIVQNISKGKI